MSLFSYVDQKRSPAGLVLDITRCGLESLIVKSERYQVFDVKYTESDQPI